MNYSNLTSGYLGYNDSLVESSGIFSQTDMLTNSPVPVATSFRDTLSRSITLPPNIKAGQTILIIVTDLAASVSGDTPSGYTRVYFDTTNQMYMTIYQKISNGSDSSAVVTFSLYSENIVCVVLNRGEFQYVAGSDDGGSSTLRIGPSISGLATNELLLIMSSFRLDYPQKPKIYTINRNSHSYVVETLYSTDILEDNTIHVSKYKISTRVTLPEYIDVEYDFLENRSRVNLAVFK